MGAMNFAIRILNSILQSCKRSLDLRIEACLEDGAEVGPGCESELDEVSPHDERFWCRGFDLKGAGPFGQPLAGIERIDM